MARTELDLRKWRGWYVTAAVSVAIVGVLATHAAGALAGVWRVVTRHATDLDGATSDAERALDALVRKGGTVQAVEAAVGDVRPIEE